MSYIKQNGKASVQKGFQSTADFLASIEFEMMQMHWGYYMLTDGKFRCALQPVPGGLLRLDRANSTQNERGFSIDQTLLN